MDFVSSGILNEARVLSEDEIKPLKPKGVSSVIEGYVNVCGSDVSLRVEIGNSFPLSLPMVYLSDPDILGLIPHVGPDGNVCYADTEGILLNTAHPGSILSDAVMGAVQVLRDGVSGANRADFMDEFVVYWRLLSPSKVIPSFIQPDDTVRKVYAYYDHDRDYKWIADDNSLVRSFFNGNPSCLKSLTRCAAVYVPLPEKTLITPPKPGRRWSIDEIRDVVERNLGNQDLRELRQICRKAKSEELVILSLPRPSGGTTLVGVLFHQVSGGHPLIGGTAEDPPEPVLILRCDPQYVMPRGGSHVDFSTANTMLVGCGAIGGYAALALAQAGIGKLTLVDFDKMEMENTFRHVLGRAACGTFKTKALKTEIERKYPFVEVSTCEESIEQVVDSERTRLNKFDLVIFATGNPTIELAFNKRLHQMERGPLVVFSWVEPYGIGGHAFLTRPGIPGCLQCLYEPANHKEAALHSRVCFAEPGQFFGKDDLGCGSLYTPYSSLDAQRTAGMAVRLALDGLSGREKNNPLISWKGSKDTFEAAGFETSCRYYQGLDKMHDRRYEYIRSDCPVCGDSTQ